MIVTYAHYRLDTSQVFYIGKGSIRRAYEQRGHNKYWNAVVAKHGYKISVLANWKTDKEAFEHEKFLIACFKDLGHPLTNATDGGEGVSGWTWTDSQRIKLIAALTGRPGTFKGRKHTVETRALISQRLAGRPGPRLGVKLPKAACEAMSLRAKAQWASEEARAKQRALVKDQMHPVLAGGKSFESLHAFAAYVNRPLSTVSRWVRRGWQNKLDDAVTQREAHNACK